MMRKIQFVVIVLMATLTLVGFYRLAQEGDWSAVANPFCVGLVSLSTVGLRDITDGKSHQQRPILIGILTAIAVAFGVMAILSGQTGSKITTGLILAGTLLAVSGYFWQLRTARSTDQSVV